MATFYPKHTLLWSNNVALCFLVGDNSAVTTGDDPPPPPRIITTHLWQQRQQNTGLMKPVRHLLCLLDYRHRDLLWSVWQALYTIIKGSLHTSGRASLESASADCNFASRPLWNNIRMELLPFVFFSVEQTTRTQEAFLETIQWHFKYFRERQSLGSS